VVGLTVRAVEVKGDFKAQVIVNTLWASRFPSIHSPDVASRLTHVLETQIAALAARVSLDFQEQSQLHQFFVGCDVDKALSTCVQGYRPGSWPSKTPWSPRVAQALRGRLHRRQRNSSK